MILKELKEKLLSGKLWSLINPDTNKDIHPEDVAEVLDTLPVESAIVSFKTFPEKSRPLLFAYLGHYLQQRIIKSFDKNCEKIVNSAARQLHT